MKTVAVMQPYFMPYAGYFRLFAAADLFVLYDCVQFPRRGWVHRNRLPDDSGALAWLTLPLRKAPYEAKIAELAFRPDAAAEWEKQSSRFPLLRRRYGGERQALLQEVARLEGGVVDYLERTLGAACRMLDLATPVLRSSALAIPETLRGQERIAAIVEAVGGQRYVNAPGGRDLYDPRLFETRGLDLRFLPPYSGPQESILARLLNEPLERIRSEIQNASDLEGPDAQSAL